jgi:hypothetical protein
VTVLLLWMMGCSTDYAIKELCIEEGGAFDIEAVSTLQDAAGYPDSRDAVVLDFDAAALGDEGTWRITGVEVLAMVPERVFDRYAGGDVLRVDIWDAARPTGDGDWSLAQAIDPAALEWEAVTLSEDAFWAGQRRELAQRRAWMPFDFSGLTDEAGMSSSTYTVAVTWQGAGLPTIGYSNFDLGCDRNWTDYGDGRWTLNSADGDGQECSWPMLRVEVETRVPADGACGGTTVSE